MVYAVKLDGQHKACLVAGGHLTETPVDSVYLSVISLRGIRLLTFVSELNELEVRATDIGNTYLESYTQEKVYIIAGPEFGDRQGHTLAFHKALYGLKSSGLRWHERLSDVLRDMGFIPSKAKCDIWMRDCGDHYEYIAVYVDNLLILSKDPSSIIKTLSDEHKFKLKGTGAVSFHLGCDWFRDDDGNLCYAPHQYIEITFDSLVNVAARTATKPILDLCLTLRYLGVPLDGPSFMFGDNGSVVNTASVPHSKLHKRHNALSYHRTREAIAAGITRFHHIVGTTNPEDILSKHWGHSSIWETLRPLLFW